MWVVVGVGMLSVKPSFIRKKVNDIGISVLDITAIQRIMCSVDELAVNPYRVLGR